MMLILKSTVSKIGRRMPESVKATAKTMFAFSCGYGAFKFSAMILPSLTDGHVEREERMKASVERIKESIRKQDERIKELETRANLS